VEKLAEDVRTNPKSFWYYASKKCHSRQTVPDIVHDSQPVGDPELKVEIFNQQISCFSPDSRTVFPLPVM